ncbi:MAG: MOSC N-terminal beta barrel domain-containing protein [Saccharospirillum sp.]|nr:MOSC N-terminal beta barrel domain-containing protein [Saccharospirillum sp.]
MSYTVILKAIWLYPVKSLPGVSVNVIGFDNIGPIEDRRWMLIDSEGRFVSQRSNPDMARFQWEQQGGEWIVQGFRGGQCALPSSIDTGQSLRVRIWQDEVSALAAPEEVSAWFSEQLGKDVRLVRCTSETQRLINPDHAEQGENVAFADGYPLLIANQSSLDALNQQAGLSLDSRRFRANLEIEGAPALRELTATRLTTEDGGAIALVKPCERCNIPAIDPDTAQYQRNVAAAIKEHCQWQGKTIFGMNGIARGIEHLAVGQSLRLE